MSLKISSDWRGKFQHVLTDMKSRFKVNENSDKTSKTNFSLSTVCRKKMSSDSDFFSEI